MKKNAREIALCSVEFAAFRKRVFTKKETFRSLDGRQLLWLWFVHQKPCQEDFSWKAFLFSKWLFFASCREMQTSQRSAGTQGWLSICIHEDKPLCPRLCHPFASIKTSLIVLMPFCLDSGMDRPPQLGSPQNRETWRKQQHEGYFWSIGSDF